MLPAVSILVLLSLTPAGVPSQQPAADSGCAADQRWGYIGHALVEDMKQLGSKDFLVTFGAGLGAAMLVHPWDDNADRWADRLGPSRVTRLGGYLGQASAQAPFIGGALLAGAAMEPPCFPAFGSDLTRASILNGALTVAIKYTVRRERPNQDDRLSFLSGHASSTFALATVAHKHFGWKAGAPGYLLAGYTAWSRLRDNKHWISDVVAGSALGIAVGLIVVRPDESSSSTSPSAVMPLAAASVSQPLIVIRW